VLILRWTRRTLIACAVGLLGYCGFVLIDARHFQIEEDRQLDRLRPASLATVPPAASGGLIGRIGIPRLGLSVIVMEGTSSKTLRRAAGHIAGTSLPGQPGNIGISGHRDTFFRPLRHIERNDIITLTTVSGEYRYRVLSTSVVGPDDVAVLEPGGNEILTLVTCYPFYFVGPAPNRFIVRAERVA
jgi:LPXTG-site transpeptidase (sortase) family protein